MSPLKAEKTESAKKGTLDADWNSLARITGLLQKVLTPEELMTIKPNSGGIQTYTLKVRDVNFSYQISIGQSMPAFTFVPEGSEIYHRLIIRASLSKSVTEFNLSKSCC